MVLKRNSKSCCEIAILINLCFPHRGLILMQHLIVLRHGNAEDDGGDVLKTMNPLFPLRPLTANVEQLEVEVLEGEVDFHDARRLHSRPQDVLLCRLVVLCSESVQVIKETEM